MSDFDSMYGYIKGDKRFTVIHFDNNLVFAFGVYKNFTRAIGAAYKYANDLILSSKSGEVGSLYELEGEGGMGLKVKYGESVSNVFILEINEEESDEH